MSAAATAVEVGSLDATAQADLVRRGEIDAVELVEGAIDRIEALDPALNAVVTRTFEQGLVTARSRPEGPFGGVPFLVKDLAIEAAGVRFTEGSRFLRDHVSAADSELMVRFRAAGLVLLGKTATPEFGMLPTCEAALFGATHNPWDTRRSTSGSSGGSAAAVASGMVPIAHANDLGGSIRFPASACGLFGLKPTRARNSLGPNYGDVMSGLAVEHALTRSVRDSAALLDATAGPAPGDPYWAPPARRPFAAEVGADPGRLRIAWTVRTPGGGTGHSECVAAVESAVRLCEALGHEVVEADIPGLDETVGQAIGTLVDTAAAWIARYWIRRIGREPREEELEPVTRAYREAGERVSAARYLTAIEDLQRFARGVAAFLTSCDMWLTPTMSELPARLGDITSTPEEPMRAAERGGRTVEYPLIVANITGNPAMSVPLHWTVEGLPVGVHFLGRFGEEAALLRLASQLEQARPWAGRWPPTSSHRLGSITREA